MVESDLIHKLESKESENLDLRAYNEKLEDKVNVKSEAIEKAHKVI